MYDKQKAVLMECLDLLAGVPFSHTIGEKQGVAQSLIDTMCDYPKPRQKGEEKEENPKELGAYLYTSNARNACKLTMLGYIPTFGAGFAIVQDEIEAALSLLTDGME